MPKISKVLITLLISGALTAAFLWFWLEAQPIEADSIEENDLIPENSGENLVIIQENSLVPVGNLPSPDTVVRRIKVIVTAYSSSPEETDESPLITASGSQVKEGIIANNLLSFGTKIRIPEIYGDEIFVVEDRMHWRKGYYHIDVWFPTKEEAQEFGAKTTYIEVLEG